MKFKAGSDLSSTVKSILSDGKGTDVNVEELELAIEKIERASVSGGDTGVEPISVDGVGIRGILVIDEPDGVEHEDHWSQRT